MPDTVCLRTRRRLARASVFLSLTAGLLACRPCRSAGPQAEPESLATYDPVFSYACGPINLYAAMRILGKDVDFRQVINECNLDGRGQSDLAILERTARELGLFAQSVHMDMESLKRLNALALLHVPKPREHFVLYTGIVDGRFRLIDGTYGENKAAITYLPPRQLRREWDGNALIIALDAPVVNQRGNAASLYTGIPVGLVFGCALLAVFSLVNRKRPEDADSPD